MKIHIMSDIHNEFEAYDPPRVDADVIVLAGDIDTDGYAVNWANLNFPDKQIVYVLGNHEHYHSVFPGILDKMKSSIQGNKVSLLENECLKIGGVNFLGCTLWTDFQLFGDCEVAMRHAQQNMNDYKSIHGSQGNYETFTPQLTAFLHKQSLSWLNEKFSELKDEKVVVVTHHAPSLKSIPGKFKNNLLAAAYASNLDEIIEDSGAELWIHGHVHSTMDYMIGETRVICNPRGYPSQSMTGFYPELIVEV